MERAVSTMPAHVSVFDPFGSGESAQTVQSIRWEYDGTDPLAVRMCAPGGYDGSEIVWIFDRAILSDALSDAEDADPLAGSGDVMASADATDFVLYLSSPEGRAALIFEREPIAEFLADTYEIIPAQSEGDQLSDDLDAFLSDVLGYAPAETVSDTPRTVETKELHFPMSGMTYTVPADSPSDLAEWEAELLHSIYTDEQEAGE